MKLPYTRKEIFGAVVVILFFAIAQYYARHYAADIRHMIGAGQWSTGMVIYGAAAIVAIVVAPISSLPLVPLAAAVWGSFTTAVVTLVAWTAGSMIAFALARRYGRRVIGRVVDMKSMQRMEAMIGEKGLFVSTVLLRMVIPVDILSYALGLFSTIRFVPYSVATIIGMVPFVLFFSYAIQIAAYQQALIAVAIISIVIVILSKRLKGGEGKNVDINHKK